MRRQTNFYLTMALAATVALSSLNVSALSANPVSQDTRDMMGSAVSTLSNTQTELDKTRQELNELKYQMEKLQNQQLGERILQNNQGKISSQLQQEENTALLQVAQPNPAIPFGEQAPYVLGSGDEISAFILGTDVDLERSSHRPNEVLRSNRVMPDGTFQLPPLGPVQAAGLTLKELEDQLNTEIKRYYRHGIVSLSLTKLKDLKISVVGAVPSQGAYVLPPETSVTQAIEKAGGVTLKANIRQVVVRGADGGVKTFDLWNSDGVQQEMKYRLGYGDVIFIPEVTEHPDLKLASSYNLAHKNFKVRVIGSVVHPGEYEATGADNVLAALGKAGGFAPYSNKSHVKLVRSDLMTGKITKSKVDMGDLMAGKEVVTLYPDDVIMVDTSIPKQLGKHILELPRSAGGAFFQGMFYDMFLND